MIKFVRGDLLQASTEAVVNTVNTVGVMGKGIALQFKRQFPINFKAYASACKRGEVRIGQMFVHDQGNFAQPRWIINFPTKDHWRSPSSLEFISAGLEDLKRVIAELGIQSIAVPALGCSNGGLHWNAVRPLIENALGKLDSVYVEVFEPMPDTATLAPLRPLERQLPFTPLRAALVHLFALYSAFGDDLGRLEAQKLAYFLTNAGMNSKLVFIKKQFGPYAEALNFVLQDMEGQFTEGFGDRQRASHLRVRPDVLGDALAFLETEPATLRAVHRAAAVTEGFETPAGMELLASVHWLAHREATQDPAAAWQAMQSWNEHKASVFTQTDVLQAWEQLREYGWLEGIGAEVPVSR